MNATIEIDGLRKRFGPTQALDGMTFTVHPGHVTGFVGPNSAGKSTTVRVVLGLDAPDAGTATIGGRPYHSLKNPLGHVGSLLDAGALQPGRSAHNHLLWLAHSQGLVAGRVDEVIALAGLESAARRKAGGYSLGMRQRLGIAAALLGDPAVLIFDEPFNGMDPEGIVWMRGFLRSLAAQGRAVLVSSHLMSELQDTAGHVVVVGRGQVITAFVFAATNVSSSCGAVGGGSGGGPACPAPPAGPGGEPVQDAFYFAHQQLTGNGTITVQMTSLAGQITVGPSQMAPGLQPWSKAGIIIKENTSQGSAYAAMMTTGSHGVRMQWDYVNDTPGLTGSVSAASPRWLRLVRDGDTITGYDSADGTHWTLVGTATLPGLTSTVQAGLFAAAPSNGNTATATGVFRHIGLSWPATRWTGTNVGGSGANGVAVPGKLRQSAGAITVTGSGDITPLAGNGAVLSVQRALAGTPIGLIPLIVVGAMFITAEYRRGLIRVSLTASPRRGRLLAAKAVVIGAVSFVTGMIAAALAVAVGTRTLARTGVPLWPVPALTLARMVVGTGALLAVAAMLALAIGTAARRSAAAVAAVIVVIFVPYLLVLVPPLRPGPGLARGGFTQGGLSLVAREWLLRITPAAGFSVQQVLPRLSQVTGAFYSPNWGYYPLAPWTGFAVECAWAAAALTLAFYLLRRRDA